MIRRCVAFALKVDHFHNRSDSAVPDRANIVRLSISSRRKNRARRRPLGPCGENYWLASQPVPLRFEKRPLPSQPPDPRFETSPIAEGDACSAASTEQHESRRQHVARPRSMEK
jgi:hypothetical protein